MVVGWELSSPAFMDLLLEKESVVPRLTAYVFDICTLHVTTHSHVRCSKTRFRHMGRRDVNSIKFVAETAVI